MAKAAAVLAIEGADAAGPAVLVCEHASNALPKDWGDPGIDAAQQQSHVAWDPGALDLARGLARLLDAPLIFGRVSRLIYDLNRPPHSPAAMPDRSELHDIPGNRDLAPALRRRRTDEIYLPFHAALAAMLAHRLAIGQMPVLITVHSFTPVYFGRPRAVEFGVIHDRDDRLARAIAAAATGLETRLNAPYSAADGVAHTLALHATPMGLRHAMLELRNDLLAGGAGAAMAQRLAPVLRAAIGDAA
ncbi:N-formylglutamate amidohydrolase [Paracoccus spongiarum]